MTYETTEIDTGTPQQAAHDAPGFLEGLSEPARALAADNGWTNVEGVLDDYRSMQDRLSGALVPPGGDASQEEKSAFYAEVAKSWTPEGGYRFNLPDALPEDFPYDQSFAQEASGWFQEAGLHPVAAQKLHDKWVGKMAEQFGANGDAAQAAALKQSEAAEAAHQALVKEYGAPDSGGYQNVVAKADRALTGLKTAGVDLTGWFAEKGALTQAGENGLQQVVDPVAVKLLAFIHDSAFAEDGLGGLKDGGGGGNPFDRARPNLKMQSELLERNPLRARQLIVSAGRDPGLFRL